MSEALERAEFEAHFESLERQRAAVRLGMWVFLSSEFLLFGALIALYATMRAHYPAGFALGVRHADVIAGSINTAVLLVSSYLIARAVRALRASQARLAAALTGGTVLLGAVFLAIKSYEYAHHLSEGAGPAGRGALYLQHPVAGLASYFNLYWFTTSLHAFHVLVGISVLAFFGVAIVRRRLGAGHAHRLEVGALYWHLVDVVWIFLWPLYYLMK